MKPLAEPAIAAVERGDIEIMPDNRRTEYFEWMRNIRDWCISRQLWWGHRIPAWYCGDCKEIIVARQAPAKCTKCGSSKLTQDSDVLETWFSSALWPFSTMGWPDDTPDYRKYYPTTLLVTAYDILFFWVARMIMMGPKFTGQAPFKQVWMHSIVRNAEGQKMSKSKGTGIDPVEMNEKFGTDAMRFTLASMAAPGTDIILTEDRILSYRAFANKIWNAARFVFMNLDKYETAGGETLEVLASPDARASAPYSAGGEVALIDRWIFSRLNGATAQVNDALEHFRFHEAAHVVYHFFWGDFCDWYIEWVKPELVSPDRTKAAAAWKNLFAAFETALRLLHPFMPFLTEELWHQLPQRDGAKSIALDRFPEPHANWNDANAESEIAVLQESITNQRDVLAKFKIQSGASVTAYTVTSVPVFELNLPTIQRLSNRVNQTLGAPPAGTKVLTERSGRDYVHYFVQAGTSGDNRAEIEKLRKDFEQLSNNIASNQHRLADQAFRSRAPEHIVKGLETTLDERRAELEKVKERLKTLENNP
jgi:valyl-tRNA synthetase